MVFRNSSLRFSAGVFLALALILSACSQSSDREETELQGSVAGRVYFSPLGSFSVDLSRGINPKSLKDKIISDGSAVVFDFSDTAGIQYSVMATFIIQAPDREFVPRLVAKNLAQHKQALETQTPDGLSCYEESYLAQDKKGKFVAKQSVVFHKNLVIFDVVMTGQPEKDPRQATENIEKAVRKLWEITAFRGRFNELPGAPARSDPRIPITVYAAQQTAHKLGYDVELQRTGKQIVRISTDGKQGRIILSLGIQPEPEVVMVGDSLACEDTDRKIAGHMRSIFFTEFQKRLTREFIKIRPNQDYDEELLLHPEGLGK